MLIFTQHFYAYAHETDLIKNLKEDPKGPFEQIRWFCNDGTILPAKAGCSKNGGGIQHADWKPQIKSLREQGLPIATIFAALNDHDLEKIKKDQSLLPAMLVERHLVAADNGWIYQRAKFYRGALQFEDESKGAKNLLSIFLYQKDWIKNNFLLAREALRLLPIERNSTAMSEIRGLANAISDISPNFLELRNKIHSIPGLSDAMAVRNWLNRQGSAKSNKSLVEKTENLASKIEEVFGGNLESSHILDSIIWNSELKARKQTSNLIEQLVQVKTTREKLALLSELLLQVRYIAEKEDSPFIAEKLLDASIDIEGKAFQYAIANSKNHPKYSRHEALEELRYLTRAVFGTGMISQRAYFAAEAALSRLLEKNEINSTEYWKELSYLANIPV
ncbi:MAG: hypothetical protein KDD56_09320 [Bdellovibrionales bacterium]|nr:hypothetical protein [Bdellovibrionales bacterium]